MTDNLFISHYYFRGITTQFILSILLDLILVFCPLSALYAAVDIVKWDFNNSNTDPSIDLKGGSTASSAGIIIITPFPTIPGNPATNSTPGWQARTWPNATPSPTKYFEFKVNLTDYEPTQLTFIELRQHNASPLKCDIEYSVDGSNFTLLTSPSLALSASTNIWSTHQIDLQGIPALVNANSVYFRFYAYNASATFGTWIIDDVTVSGIDADKAPTAALLNTPLPNISPNFSENYTFEVEYKDDSAINIDTLDNNNIQVTIPSGGTLLAEFVTVDDLSNGTPRIASYKLVSPPSGSWEIGQYTINVIAGQVADTQVPSYVATGSLGSFRVEPVPLATLNNASPVTSSGGTEYNFQVEYSDNQAIDITSITANNGEIEVTGPNSFQTTAIFDSIDDNSNGTPRIVTYKFTAPSLPTAGWDPADEGFYNIAIKADMVKNVWGLAVAEGNLGTFYVDLNNPPLAAISSPLPTITMPGNTNYTIQVQYTDNVAIDINTLDDNDITVLSPTNDTIVTTKVDVDNNTPGTPRLVTYQMIPPGGIWDTADNGIYTIQLEASQVMDMVGTAAVASQLGQFTVDIPITFTLDINKAGEGTGTITGDGIDCGTTCHYVYLKGSSITLTVIPTEDSYFDGWQGSCDTLPFTIMADTTCTATFHKKPTFTLNINKAGKGTGTITGSGIDCGDNCSSVYLEGKIVTLIATPANNSYFGGWEGDCTTSSVTMKANMNCIANFHEKSDPPPPPLSKTMILTLTQQGTGEGEFIFQPAIPADRIDCDTDKKQCRYSIDTASWIKVTAEPHSDSRWVGWTGANPKCYQNQGNRLEFFMSENYSCVAEFEGNPKVLSLVTIGNGQVTISPVSNSIPCETGKCFQFAGNSEVTLTPQAGNEFHFENWSGDPDCQDGQVKMDTDKICVATFGDTPSVNLVLIYDQSQGQIVLTPAGENCGYRCQRYKRDTLVTLTAQPQSGFQLASWGSDCSSQTQATLGIILNKDFRCEVTFMPATNPPPIDPSQPTYSLTVNSTGSGFGTITSLPGGIHCGLNCTGLYPVNTTVTLQAEPAPNSVFVGWDESCPQGQVYLNANKTCLATFEVPGVVEWTSPTQINVTEEDKPVILRVGRLGGKYGAATVDYTITDNTTIAGSDYNATAGTLTWAVGDNTEKTVTLTILPDKLKEETESLTVTLVNPQGGVRLGTSTTTVVHIADVPAFSSIQLAMPEYRVNEGDKKEAVIFATRAGKSLGVVSTDFKTIDGTAIANNDYTPVSGTLTWADGDRTQQAIKIPILQDSLNENHETFGIQLANLTGEAQFGQYAQATVTIVDTPSMGSLEFAQAEYVVNESAGKVTIQVNRIGDSSGEISINYATTNEGSAQVGADFTPSQGILQWANGDSEPKSFDILIGIDEQLEGEETVSLSLSNPTGGASLGAISTAILKITDVVDDNTNPPPATETSVIQFTGTTYEIMEQAAIEPLEGVIWVPVNRTGSSKGPATVKYKTQDGTAIAGKHYQASQGELTWATGETGEKRIYIDTWDNKLKEETKSFSLLLSDPSGAVLGEYPQTTVLIKDDDGNNLVRFSSENNYLALEKSGQAQVIVSRSNGSAGQVIIHYTTVDGTAKAGEDYLLTDGVLTWADGEYDDQTISIPLIADQMIEDNETIQLRLFDPQGDVILAQPSEVAVTIIETETTPCEVTGKVVDCFLVLSTDSPILPDIKITSRGSITGGRLAGQIQNAGRVQNVMLMPNSFLMGGQVTGSLSGDADQPTTAFIRNVKLKGTHLERVVIGEGCQFDQSTTFGEGVLFQTNELVPEEQNLAPILGYMEQAIFGQRAVKLRGDVLYLSAIEGLLGTINALPQLANFGWQIKIEPRYGFLTLDVGNLRFAAMPLQVNQTLTEMIEGISLGVTQQADGQVSFRNQNGRKIITQPVIQDPITLQEQLRQLGLNTITMLANGNLKVTLADGSYFSGRASLVAQRVPQETPLGLHYTEQPIYLIFKDDQGQHWQQFIYPAAADPQVLANQTEEFFLANDGQLQIRQGERVYQGRLDYLVVTGKQPRSGNLQFKDIADINGDQCGDYQIFYNSQENQIMFGQCSSH